MNMFGCLMNWNMDTHQPPHEQINRERYHPLYYNIRQDDNVMAVPPPPITETENLDISKQKAPEEEKKNKESPPKKEKEELKEEAQEVTQNKMRTPLYPIEEALGFNVTDPQFLIPIVNDLTFMSLMLLNMPLIVPLILVPTAFFVVGIFLIPVVRINYFLTHVDDGEDGRSFNAPYFQQDFQFMSCKVLNFIRETPKSCTLEIF